jgi:hypothetical protein
VLLTGSIWLGGNKSEIDCEPVDGLVVSLYILTAISGDSIK